MSTYSNPTPTMAANPFECPITYVTMTDPVIDRDGNSYERSAIVKWLLTHDCSPLTRRPMKIEDLQPNRALKALIEAASQVPALSKETASASNIGKPLNLVLLADVSGSMNETCATIEGASFTRVQLLEHALMTVLHSMSDMDHVSLVTFNNRATVLTGLLPVTDANRQLLIEKASSMSPGGGTNIWAALSKGLEVSKTSKNGEPVHILLFTDGISNEDPPSGIIPTLRSYLSGEQTNARLHTFGFGNDINSQLLFDISRLGNSGVFGYISGPEMVGTVFVNTLAYVKSFEQPMFSAEDLSLQQTLIDILERPTGVQADLLAFGQSLNPHGTTEMSPFAKALALDCLDNADDSLGQIYKAHLPQYLRKWGQHYVRSVICAYRNMFPLNFKDNGVQFFKTDSFMEIQNRIEEIFLTLEPPKPRYGQAISSAIFSATTYNPHGGCIMEGTLVVMYDPSEMHHLYIHVEDVRPGMTVSTPDGLATVKRVIKLKYNGPIFRYGNAALTEFHPVRIGSDGEWFFPGSSSQFIRQEVRDVYVYDFILDKGHVVNLIRVNAVTLNHNFQSPVVQHDYFGSSRIEDDLRKHPTYETGYITLDTYKFIRDEKTGLVIALDF